VSIRLRDGSSVEDARLDRLEQFDPRSRRYGIRALLGTRRPRSYTWRHYVTDQGRQGACVGHAVTQEAAARPVPVFGDPTRNRADQAALERTAREVYSRAQRIDPWEGEEPTYSGTSVLAGVQIGQQLGWWSEYRWALGPGPEAAAQDVILALGYAGPVIMGTVWRSGMWRADADGYLRGTGNDEGGHSYLLVSYSAKRDAVWTPNSWGGAGQGWITRTDLVSLLAAGGEACIPIQRRLR
jgi:hypothetical protein